MGIRGELFSTRFMNDRRTYFFNVKENRREDIYITLVESKKSEHGSGFDRHQIVVFEEDFERFKNELEVAMDFVKNRK